MTAATVTPYTGEAPRRTQPADDFSNNVDDFVTYIPSMVEELNEVSEFVNDRADQTQTDAANSAISAATAQAASNYAGKWSTATGEGLAGESYNHDGATWQILEYLVSITTVEPSNAASEWQQITYVNFYDGEKTYARDVRSVDLINNKTYVSAKGGNLGNTPSADDGTWWAEDNPPLKWVPGRDYEEAEQSYSPVNGRLYASQQTPNVGNEPSIDDGSYWLTEYGLVSKPSITYPVDEDTGAPVRPLLTASAYELVGSDSPQEWSNWQVSTDVAFADIVYDSGLVVGTSHKVSTQLAALTTHYVRVAYKGVRSDVSAWSDPVGFTTTVALSDYFNISLETGNGVALETVTGVDLANNEGSLWIINRDAGLRGYRHTTRKGLLVNELIRDGSANITDADGLQSYEEGGHIVGSAPEVNGSAQLISSFTFRDLPGFHDTVTFTGNGVGTTRYIPHNLQHEYGFYIVRGQLAYVASSQEVTTRAMHKDWTQSSSKAFSNIGSGAGYLVGGDDAEFGVASLMNTNGQEYVCELFAHNPLAGIYCLTWTGNGSTQKLTTGFPAGWILAMKSGYTMVSDIESGGSSHIEMDVSSCDKESGGVSSFDSDGVTVNGEMNTNGVAYYGVIVADPKQF